MRPAAHDVWPAHENGHAGIARGLCRFEGRREFSDSDAELFRLGVPLIPRIITEIAHSETGIDIHPGAEIGSHFTIDHGTGIVVGATCIIGKNVKLYQGVTLGAKSFPLDEDGNPIKNNPRHPIIHDDVIIYSNATILGRITIGKGAVIGANVWITHNVEAGSQVTNGR